VSRDGELLKRIRRLENLVERAGGERVLQENHDWSNQDVEIPSITNSVEEESTNEGSSPATTTDSVVGSRYLGGDFWIALSDSLGGLKELLEESTLDDAEEAMDAPVSSPGESNEPSPSSFPFGLTFAPLYNPPPDEAAVLFGLYFSNVDPVFKLLHRPTLMSLLPKAAEFFPETNVRSALPALFCSMYFASITSISPEECRMKFGNEKDTLLARYKNSTERALARADFLNSMDLMALQAFVIYLVRI
jgi:hypothetical protein